MPDDKKIVEVVKKNKVVLLYRDLEKALSRLKEAVNLPSTVLNQDATIQRFEFTYELSWKLMKALAQLEGLAVTSPKNAMRQAAVLGLIDDPLPWFDFLTARNYTVHTYKEDTARYVYQKAKDFVKYVENLLTTVKKFMD